MKIKDLNCSHFIRVYHQVKMIDLKNEIIYHHIDCYKLFRVVFQSDNKYFKHLYHGLSVGSIIYYTFYAKTSVQDLIYEKGTRLTKSFELFSLMEKISAILVNVLVGKINLPIKYK